MTNRLWAWDLWDSLRYGSATTLRWLLAFAATLHGLLILISQPPGAAIWTAIFLLDGFCLWWRIFDSSPRVGWAYTVNVSTTALWASVTYGLYASAYSYWPILPVLTGYIVLTIMSFISTLRTEATTRDRGHA